MQKYQDTRRSNNKKISTYEQDSVEYFRTLAKYEKDVAKYLAYNHQMRSSFSELCRNTTDFDIKKYAATHDALYDFFANIKDANIEMKASLKNIISSAKTYAAEGYDMTAVLKKAEQVKLSKLSDKEFALLKTGWNNYQTKKFESHFFKHYTTNKNFTSKISSIERSLSRIYNQLPAEGMIKPYQLRQMHTWKEKITDQYDFAWLGKTNDNAKRSYQKRKGAIDAFLEMEKAINELQRMFYKQKNALGILSPQEVVQAYGNAMKITSLGWINCDRFYQSPEPKMNLEIITKVETNTVIYVVFEDINAVMMANAGHQNYIANNVPQNRKAKIIGLRILGNEAEVFVEEGTIAELNKVKPVFKKKTLKEVEGMMAGI